MHENNQTKRRESVPDRALQRDLECADRQPQPIARAFDKLYCSLSVKCPKSSSLSGIQFLASVRQILAA